MRRKQLILIFLVFVRTNLGFSQDMHLSMYDAAPLFLNPSLTGVFESDWRLHAQYRTQWKAVNFKPYTTGLISFDMPYKKWGFGGQITNYRAGIGNYNALQALFSVGYTIPLDKSKKHMLSFGAQGGLTQKSIEYQLLTFDNQYSIDNGGVFDNTLSSGENFGSQSLVIPDLNAGVLYYFAKQQSKLNPFIGLSAFNLLTPTETLFSGSNQLPMRFYAHLGSRINFTETFFVIPKVLLMKQETFSEITIAGDVGYYLKSNELYLLGGIIYRNKDAVSISLGARKDNYIAKINYDINTSSLISASSGRGGFELSFTYMHGKKSNNKVKICPRL
ncbi:MAG: PorP/SprF family type IX secretion system membrane protein [Putridiphycobacter sp.]